MSNATRKTSFDADFAQHCGTDSYTRHMGISCTDGVMSVAELCGCYWLLDAIASHWTTDKRLREEGFLVVTLTVRDDDTAVLEFRDDYDSESPERFKPLALQEIEYTDFSYNFARFYLIDGVLLLPSEY